MNTPWHLFEVDDGAQHIICAPDESTLRAEMGRWSVGEDIPDDEVEISTFTPSAPFTLTYPGDTMEALAEEGCNWPPSATLSTTPEHGWPQATASVADWCAFYANAAGIPVYLSCSEC